MSSSTSAFAQMTAENASLALAGGSKVRRDMLSANPRTFAKRRSDKEIDSGDKTISGILSLALYIAIAVVPISAVFVGPPLVDCYDRERNFGFFAGDTFNACTARGVAKRYRTLETRLTMLVRGSGR
jgi:hypothetical protein